MPTQATRTVSLGLAIMLELAPSAAAELNKKLLRSIGYLPAGGAFRRKPFSRQHNRWQGPNGCRVARISGNALRSMGQVGNLRRIGNPPAALGQAAAASEKRMHRLRLAAQVFRPSRR